MEALNKLCDDAKAYAALKEESVKLKVAKGLSISTATMLSFLLIIAVAQMVMIALMVTLGLLIGRALGDWVTGAAIVTGFCTVVLAILIVCRKKLFTGTMVRTFIKLFFPEDNEN